VSLELEDGTTVLLKRMTTAPIVSMQLWALGGLSIEDAKTNGLGNLAMKLSPRGTKTRSASQIGEFFDSIGGEMSTGCANNTWSWQAQCLSADFGGAFEVFADVVKNPVFPDSELAPMKERVLGAIKGQDADWFSGAMRFFRAAYFGPGKSPYQFLAIGSEATVKGFTVAQVRDWYSRTIRPARRVLAIYGDVDPGAMEKAVVAQFGPRKPGSLSKAGAGSLALGGGNSATPSIDVQRVQINKTDNPQAAVIIGFDSGSSVADSRQAELALADTMTSGYGYPTGYIFETLRGRGLVYDANAYDLPGRSADLPGCFIAYAGCEPRNVSQVIDAILLNVARLQGSDRDIDTSWFERSKKLAITSDALDHEAAAAQAQTAALDELHGLGYMHHARFADRIKAVSLPDVRELAKARLSRCVVTVSTCAPELVNVKPGVRKYGEFPPVDLSPKGGGHDAGK
jgi:zinc protease